MPRKYTWIVKVPVTVKLCVEVKASSAVKAIEEANAMCNDIEGRYLGYRSNLDRPVLIAPGYNGDDEDQMAWWEDIEQCEMFMTQDAVAERKGKQ